MPIQRTDKNRKHQEYQMNVFSMEYPANSQVGFCDQSSNLSDLCSNNQTLPFNVSSHGNYPGALEAKVEKAVKRVGLHNTFLHNVSVYEVKALAPFLSQLSDLSDTPQRAKKAPQKKKGGAKKGPKAAKVSKNPSEKVRVSKRITRTETYY